MKREGSGFWGRLVVLLVAAIYSVILFAVKREFVTVSWIAYGFTMLAFLTLIVPMPRAKKYPMFGIPASVAAIAYFCLQFLCGGIIGMCYNNIDVVFALSFEIVLFALYLVASFSVLAMRSAVSSQDDYEGAKVRNIRMMKGDLTLIAGAVEDGDLKKRIADLAEAVGYSDPMSGPDLQDLEERIRSNIALLREDVDDGDLEKAGGRVEKIRRMVEERNMKCRMSK